MSEENEKNKFETKSKFLKKQGETSTKMHLKYWGKKVLLLHVFYRVANFGKKLVKESSHGDEFFERRGDVTYFNFSSCYAIKIHKKLL